MRNALQALQEVIDRGRRNVTAALEGRSGPGFDTARARAGELFAQWSTMVATLADAGGRVQVVLTDPALRPAAARERANSIVAETRAVADGALAAMRADARSILAAVEPLARPARPEPADVVQEARLAGIKSDVTMALAGLDAAATVARLVRFAADAVADGDALMLWVVASSGWPALYLERFDPPWTAVFEERLAEVLDRDATGDVAAARRVLAELRGTYGINAVLQGAEHYIRTALNDVAAGVAA